MYPVLIQTGWKSVELAYVGCFRVVGVGAEIHYKWYGTVTLDISSVLNWISLSLHMTWMVFTKCFVPNKKVC